MQPSFTVMVAAIVAVVAIAGWMLLGSRSRHRRLERLRDERDPAQAEARCVAAFPTVAPLGVRAAYRWVQGLVEIDDMPLHPDDELEALLGIDPGEIDDKFEASRDLAGPARAELDVPRPLRTVRDLMAAVLAAGCELDPAGAP